MQPLSPMAWVAFTSRFRKTCFRRCGEACTSARVRQAAEVIEAAEAETPLPGCPVRWLLTDVLQIIAEHHDRPVEQVRPVLRRLVEEHAHFDDSGDAVLDPKHDQSVDQTVELFVEVLEQVRLEAYRQGNWSDAPVTPLMCG